MRVYLLIGQPSKLLDPNEVNEGILLVFVCMKFFIPLKNFYSFGDVTIAGDGLQILTYARH